MARWVSKHGGAGFIIDYGNEAPPPWTLQGAKKHKPTNVLSEPGEVDISGHVHFGNLRASIDAVDGGKIFIVYISDYFAAIAKVF